MNNFDISSLIKCKYEYVNSSNSNHKKYFIMPGDPVTGILYITEKCPGFISGHLRMRGKNGGKYPYKYSEMIDNIFRKEENTIEVCSGSVKGRGGTMTASREERESLFASFSSCFTVDINPDAKPDLVADGQNS